MSRRTGAGLAVVAASLPMFMVSLNNLVVTNSLHEIGRELDTDVSVLQWVVNSYVLAFAGLLLTFAGLGDRYGRRRVFLVSIGVFCAGSILSALAESSGPLIAARAVQGIGAAGVFPLSLTLLAAAVPPARRSAAIGVWGAVNGLGIALGPLVGGAVTEGLAWQWIFWINVPVALIAVPLVLLAIAESRGTDRGLDLPGMALVTAGVTLTVWAVVQATRAGWGSPRIVGAFVTAAVLFVGFGYWERRAPSPLLPLRFYRIPAFVLSNIVSLAMFFGVFGSIFFIAQYMQGPMGFSPLQAGIRTLPWTAIPMVVAPVSGGLTDRLGGGRLMALGLALQGIALGWIALIVRIDLDYIRLVPPMIIAGVGMGLVFAPTAVVVLGSVRPSEHGKASGANATVREIGGAFGVAVCTTVFRSQFDRFTLLSPVDGARAFVAGMVPAMWLGVAVIAAGVVAGALIPRRSNAPTDPVTDAGTVIDAGTVTDAGTVIGADPVAEAAPVAEADLVGDAGRLRS